jgi:prevent-host-death family protein
MTKSVARRVGVHEAKTKLSELLRAVDGGQEVEIMRNGRPIARLVAAAPRRRRAFGTDVGVFAVPEDFDAPLPDSELSAFGS